MAWGILEDRTINELSGAPFASVMRTGRDLRLDDVRLLAPVAPSKVMAVGLNFRSHLGQRPVPEYPGLFAKYPTSVIGSGEAILLPPDANNVHYEGEMVLVIGRRAKNVPVERAKEYVFRVTAAPHRPSPAMPHASPPQAASPPPASPPSAAERIPVPHRPAPAPPRHSPVPAARDAEPAVSSSLTSPASHADRSADSIATDTRLHSSTSCFNCRFPAALNE